MDTTDSGDGGGGEGRQGPAPDVSHLIIERAQREIEQLREQVKKSLHVEVTGADGSPVYATGSVRRGHWRNSYGGLWEVALEMSADDTDVPVAAMEDIEIRLGGLLYASASNEVEVILHEADWDNDMRKEVPCHFGGSLNSAWLAIRIHGWPQEHSTAMGVRTRMGEFMDTDWYRRISEQVTSMYPSATLSFKCVAFFGSSVMELLNNHRLGQMTEEERREDEAQSRLVSLIIDALREAGIEEVGSPFKDRVNDVIEAAYMFESQAVVEAEIRNLVQMRLASQSHTDLLSQVRERYASVLGEWAVTTEGDGEIE